MGNDGNISPAELGTGRQPEERRSQNVNIRPDRKQQEQDSCVFPPPPPPNLVYVDKLNYNNVFYVLGDDPDVLISPMSGSIWKWKN